MEMRKRVYMFTIGQINEVTQVSGFQTSFSMLQSHLEGLLKHVVQGPVLQCLIQ